MGIFKGSTTVAEVGCQYVLTVSGVEGRVGQALLQLHPENPRDCSARTKALEDKISDFIGINSLLEISKT